MWATHIRFFLSTVQGFSSERKFEEYVKQENNSKKVLVGIIFDHKFQNSNDPLPFKVRRFYVEPRKCTSSFWGLIK